METRSERVHAASGSPQLTTSDPKAAIESLGSINTGRVGDRARVLPEAKLDAVNYGRGACSMSWTTMAMLSAGAVGVAIACVCTVVFLVRASAAAAGGGPGAVSPPPPPPPSYPLLGTKATIWSRPTGVASWTARSPGLPSDMGRNPFWADAAEWRHWLGRRDSDIALLRRSLGDGPNVSAIVYFPAYLADAAVWGPEPLARLGSVLSSFTAAGVRPMLLLGRPDIGPSGTWVPPQDPVHVPADRAWLLARLADVLALPAARSHVRFVSVYWMGLSTHCTAGPGCSEDEILAFNTAIESAVTAAGPHFRHLLHADGVFQDACWPSPCGVWNDHGYSPRSVNSSWGLMLESWVQASLVPAVSRLYRERVFTSSRVLLMQDVRNCDRPGVAPCVTGSVASDARTWFRWLDGLGLCAGGPTFAIWRFEDSPASFNAFGDALNNGSGLTTKGKITRTAARSRTCL